jgi:polyhydroxyalkanoate synthesis regulator phasin
MASSSPLWKRLFDAVDERVSPTINEVANSDDAATLVALGRRGRSELDRRMEQASRRTLHLLNLPAGSDVNRLLEHIARLEREVRDLRNLLTDRENAEFLAALSERHDSGKPAVKRRPPPRTKGGANGRSASVKRSARKAPS